MKPVDVNPSMYIGFNEENNKEGPKFKVGDVRISNIKTSYVLYWSEEVFVVKKVKNTVPRTCY